MIEALSSGNIERVRRMIEDSADVNIRDKLGMTALNVAAEERQTETVRLLIERGVDPDAKDDYRGGTCFGIQQV